MNINIVMFIVLLVALLSLFASVSYAASVTICKPISTTIQLPKPGKCRSYTVGGYKIRVCN